MNKNLSQEENDWLQHMNRNDIVKRRFQYQRNKSLHFGGTHACRITIPATSRDHIESAKKHIKTLLADIESLDKQGNYKELDLLHLFRNAIFVCNRNLKHDADDSLMFSRDPSNDYRGAK